jgi:hypothetical protein
VNAIPVIDPRAVYTIQSLTQTLSLKPGTLPRELRLGRLRYSKRAGRVMILGCWALEWVASGEVRRHAKAGNGAASDSK